MKNSKNKILAAAVCGVIVSSIGTSFVIDNKKEVKGELPQDVENIEIDNEEIVSEEIEGIEKNIEDEVENDTENSEEIIASNEEVSENSNNVENNNGSNTISSINEVYTQDSQNTTVNNNASNSTSNNTIVEEGKDETSNSGNSNSTNNDVVENTSKYKDGTYSGSASGFAGTLQVNVQISNDIITSITVTSHNDTPGFADMAIEEIPSKIIAIQSTSVDVVSGATYTSKGIINAVSDALSKA
ncbi:FMN-binding protein [Clostridium disporicum]|uniref:FMN-binding protein n=1 Tax=Clostridium disporicum TaxID=84024 RepID=UPI002904F9B3|nr:FMN-binding protein [Clostridium celatum]MDU4324621.1 FMN-binding protein [Clostridium celatum]